MQGCPDCYYSSAAAASQLFHCSSYAAVAPSAATWVLLPLLPLCTAVAMHSFPHAVTYCLLQLPNNCSAVAIQLCRVCCCFALRSTAALPHCCSLLEEEPHQLGWAQQAERAGHSDMRVGLQQRTAARMHHTDRMTVIWSGGASDVDG
jgi:hypothetical protein